ncbi:MAG: putative toxin-antitoxin system toxin component, PIN family [Caldilineaceae bacterium]|jgi:putative PIN family toxin of toxin-antitoxin system|nr:putative toxin-antitoxin system toxin component, PIN family [Caldilineaceae bacterium]
MRPSQIVIDTSVLVAGLRSRNGYAFQLLSLVGTETFDIHLSVPLVLEYEAVLYRELPHLLVARSAVDAILDYHCAVAETHQIFFLWRPFLPDPLDDMVLELAVKANCDYIVTFNKRHFGLVHQFGLQAVTPREFLTKIGVG